jgi:hypothetical protein
MLLETIEAWIGFTLVLIFLGTIVGCFLMWYGARLAGVAKAGFVRSLWAALFSSAWTYFLTLSAMAYPIPPIKPAYALALGLLISALFIKRIYLTSSGKALVVWIFFVGTQALAIFLAAELFIGSLHELYSATSIW